MLYTRWDDRKSLLFFISSSSILHFSPSGNSDNTDWLKLPVHNSCSISMDWVSVYKNGSLNHESSKYLNVSYWSNTAYKMTIRIMRMNIPIINTDNNPKHIFNYNDLTDYYLWFLSCDASLVFILILGSLTS